MAEKGSGVTENWPKWQIALAVGTPVALGIAGFWYYRHKKSRKTSRDEVSEESSRKVQKEPTPVQNALDKAQAAKNKGNKYFKGGKYDQAIECYTEAIEVCPPLNANEIATFYQNRAAAYEQLKNYNQVVADCSHALEYNTKYVKALFRRAKACEIQGELTQCLEDVTAVCILEGFQNQQSLIMADRVLKELGKDKAKQAYKTREPVKPSAQFIRAYFSAFCNDPLVGGARQAAPGVEAEEAVTEVEVEKPPPGQRQGAGGEDEPEKHTEETPEKEKVEEMEKGMLKDRIKPSPFQQALDCMASRDYDDVVQLCSTEMHQSNPGHLPEALLLRGTFYLLRGEANKAMEDLDRLLDLPDIAARVRSNALIKRGSLNMQNGDQQAALGDFDSAVKVDPDNSDIYHHRGQLYLLIDKVQEAVEDFTSSVKLSPQFPIAQVQKCYTDYRLAFNQRSPMLLHNAIASFEQTIEKFPQCAEGYALYGQALCDQQNFDKADANFKKALDLEPENGNNYVHRGLLRLQWKQDIEEAVRLINSAIQIDDRCEFAYETLGTIEIQRGNLDTAMGLFNKAISLAKTEVEMAHLFSLLDAAVAQSKVAKNLNISIPNMAASFME